ncbi:helix-turn-helix domain-containing protein, partial [Rhodococcus sp. WS4]
MAMMTSQPPLPLIPDGARPFGAAAAIVEDTDGGRVFVHGHLAYAWDAGDTAARRFAAASLMRIKAATQLEIAAAFGVKPASVRRWEAQLTGAGIAGLLAERKGPKRKSKLTDATVATI